MPRADVAMRRELVTPEGAALAIRLGNAGTRASAFILDAAIIIVTLIAVSIATILALIGSHGTGGTAMLVLWLLFFFVLRNFYFILFEGSRRGATPGKRINHLRVVSRDGSALSLDQVIARNLMREIEIFMPLTLPFAHPAGGTVGLVTTLFGLGWALTFTLFPLFNRDRLRVGDLLAGTRVIVVPRQTLLPDLAEHSSPAAQGYRFTEAQFAHYGIAELQRLEDVLRGENEEALWVVANAIAGRIGWSARIHDARPFLQAYYAGLRQRLERSALLGRRRRDKFDRPDG